jgi:hypothetical protein
MSSCAASPRTGPSSAVTSAALVAIDPLACAGESAYDVTHWASQWSLPAAARDRRCHRIARELGLDGQRVGRWAPPNAIIQKVGFGL